MFTRSIAIERVQTMKNNLDFFVSEQLRELVDDDILQKLKSIYCLHGYGYEVQFWLDCATGKANEPMQAVLMWVYEFNTDLFGYKFSVNNPITDAEITIKPIGGILIMDKSDNFTPCFMWDCVYCIKILLKAMVK